MTFVASTTRAKSIAYTLSLKMQEPSVDLETLYEAEALLRMLLEEVATAGAQSSSTRPHTLA